MTYQEAISYLYSLERYGVQLGLSRIQSLLELMGNPHENLRVILVGGTNGKGSTCNFIASILRKAGFRVGKYTSPHFIKFNERIVVNDEEIGDDELSQLVEEIIPLISKVEQNLSHPTFFEVSTALAFSYFHKMEVDFAICEVGMGGRFDATNVVNPIVSVITTIGLDHTEYLGSSLEEIAYEKAGIVREGESVVVGVEEKEGIEALVRICEQKKAFVTQVGKDLNWELKEASIKGQKFDIKGKDLEHKDLFIRLLGRHQLVNATCGVGAIQLLHERGFRIRSEDIKSGLRVAFIRGRLEVVGKNPLVVLDVAHNPQGAATIGENLSTFKFKRLILILGILKDKDIHGIVKELAPLASVIIATRPKSDRACEPEEIIREALKYNEKTIVIEEVDNALKFAEDEATQRDLILVTGSNYTVGEALIYFG